VNPPVNDVGFQPDIASCGPLIESFVVYNTGTMRSFGSRRFARGASLVAAAFLLCLGAYLSWPAAGPGVPAAHTMAGMPHVDRETNRGGHPMDGSYLAVASEEADDFDKAPVNAGLLTTLLLAASFAATIGWLLANGVGPGVFVPRRVALYPPFVTAREDAPFLGVLRL
jgi:hypothetical protein